MAVREYFWQRATHESVVKCINWCLDQFNLRDWTIEVSTEEEPPPQIQNDPHAQGRILIWNDYLKALMWIPLGRLRKEKRNPFETVIHEMLHVLVLGNTNANNIVSELASYRLQAPLYRLFCKDTKRQIAHEREQID